MSKQDTTPSREAAAEQMRQAGGGIVLPVCTEHNGLEVCRLV